MFPKMNTKNLGLDFLITMHFKGLTLPFKRDVHRFRDSFKSICDKHGVRLGKSNAKSEK